MKTDQLMVVPFSKGSMKISHKSMMGDLGAIFDLGNSYRVSNGKSTLRLDSWLKVHATKEYIDLVSESLGTPAVVSKRGKNGGTWAHLKVCIDAAAYLDAAFKDEIYSLFLDQKLLMWRDFGGDNFIELNTALSLVGVEVLGAEGAHKGHFITLAKIIKGRVLGDGDQMGWNFAGPEQHQERTRIETILEAMLRSGVVRDWDHLKELGKGV